MKNLRNNKIIKAYAALVLLLLFSVVSGLLFGATKINFSDLVNAIFGGDKTCAEYRIFWYVRFPRVAASLVCGAALALSGAVIQGVLANKLASPSIIGINSGAGLAVTLCSAFGVVGGWKLSLFAFTGAFAAAMLVSIGSKKFGASRGTVILLGVALNSLFGAVSDTVITFSSNAGIMSNDFKVGDFSSVTYAKLIPAAVVILISVIVLFTLSNELDILTLGDENAKGLGLNADVMRVVFLIFAALLAGASVSIAGLLSFVGLIVPHAVRRCVTTKSHHLLPLSTLAGAGFVTLCDTLSRVIFAPYELPVGIVMSFLGAPFFIYILIKGRGGHIRD